MAARGLAVVVLLAGAMLGCQAHAPDSGESATNKAADAAHDPLPSAFKGYELYAWDEGGEMSFTLITGTNRLKNVQEITGPDERANPEGWVVVRGHGIEQLRSVLQRVPADTSVVLGQLEGLAPLSDASRLEVSEIVANR